MEDLPAAAFASSTANADEAADISPNPARLDSRFRRPLMKFFMRRVRDRQDAEDLTQEVFARALGSGDLARVQRPDSFLFTVATNLLRDRHRQAIRRSAAGARRISGVEPRDPVEDRGPERVLEGYESLQEALAVLNQLPERTRDIFILFQLENVKQKDIASLFGTTQKAVEKHVLKAVTHLAWHFGSRQP
ncbi:MAG TPA: sigma-70 family RNA polymerase sigma factor [Steroidobacteraceae bacterium]|jgi:RNA polymerase sigma-70 factor (ECF subfamily)|nr:sigma-70 family RNA polymerase sigma factor [Steroidobacteraceae bacterium]